MTDFSSYYINIFISHRSQVRAMFHTQERLSLTMDDSLLQAEVAASRRKRDTGTEVYPRTPRLPPLRTFIDVRLSVNGIIILATDSVGK